MNCSRCHQPVPADSSYCPSCGLPQLVYSAEDNGAPATPDRWTDAVRDAGSVEWRTALKPALLLSIPAALLSLGMMPVAFLGLFWMAVFAAWTVNLYVRRQRPGWITLGAGARIGLVTGLLAGWVAFMIGAGSLWCTRFIMGEGKMIDDTYVALFNQVSEQLQAVPSDPAATANMKALFTVFLLTPEGRGACALGNLALMEVALLVFAAAGGAVSARILSRSRRSQS